MMYSGVWIRSICVSSRPILAAAIFPAGGHAPERLVAQPEGPAGRDVAAIERQLRARFRLNMRNAARVARVDDHRAERDEADLHGDGHAHAQARWSRPRAIAGAAAWPCAPAAPF